MKRHIFLGLCITLAIVFMFLSAASCFAKMQYFTIGTGGITGVYYPLGGAISKILNKEAS